MTGPYIHTPSGLLVDVELSDEDNFVATVPELPGCVSFAPTFDELAGEIHLAITGILDVLKQTDKARYDLLMDLSTGAPAWWAFEKTDGETLSAA